MPFADRDYDHDTYRRPLRQPGNQPAIPERGQPHGTGPVTLRSAVEQTISRLHGFRRLRIRREQRDDIHQAPLAREHGGSPDIRSRALNTARSQLTDPAT
ncbi:hypothetical protein BN159_0135 [Streptomyces davaonensis JCM 4913]|uniref:Uncharacterized protein n=1 Tax=Streptomyces davaonensis (strain DSM 101723 / JCM 4913 / KCC S-0913 / 768) TaxID=1214101 RepID=K4QVV9_STRDJ|nr:hypothetical protein [Streptomyces davaonensis]CCK24514.1 hypothetical protein BN159_0135 [Streptomyces davaonensis JCM 4913]